MEIIGSNLKCFFDKILFTPNRQAVLREERRIEENLHQIMQLLDRINASVEVIKKNIKNIK